jgi:RND superfamily putative drug exporter
MISAAAIILAGTFGSLMLTGIAQLTELGFGVGVGILITAPVLAIRLVQACLPCGAGTSGGRARCTTTEASAEDREASQPVGNTS